MTDLIRNIPINFAKLRSAAAQSALLSKKLLSDPHTEEEARLILSELVANMQSFAGPITKPSEYEEFTRISSSDWNAFQQTVLIDLTSIYEAVATLESASKAMEVIARSDLSQTKAAILKAINQLEVYQFLKEHPEFQDLKIIDFVRAVNDSKRSPRAQVDNNIRMLELPARTRQPSSSARLKGRRTKVATRVLGGGRLLGFSDAFSSSNIVDSNPNNFWVEVMSTNAPVEFDYEASWGMYHATGVVAEVVLNFSHLERINNFTLLPFSEMPYNIVDISYRESASSGWTTIPGFNIMRAVEDWVELDFPYIAVHEIRISIEQQNYTRRVSLVPQSVLRKNNLLAQMQEKEYSRKIHGIDLTTKQEGLIKAQPEQLNHLIALHELDSELGKVQFTGNRESEYRDATLYAEAINKVVDKISPGSGNSVREPTTGVRTETEDELKYLRSYDYLFGIRMVAVNSVTYEPLAYYESPEFVTNGTIVQVQLDTEEVHPEFKEDDGVVSYRRTSIEYEIETSPSTRFPIVPLSDLSGASYAVRDELVKLTGGRGRLRFTPLGKSISVRKNGVRIPMMDIVLDGRNIIVGDADKNAIYTATYNVSVNETRVNIDGLINPTKLIEPEVFTGTDPDNKVVLKYYPYIVYEIVRDTDMWTKDPNNAYWSWTPDFVPLATGSIGIVSGTTAVDLTVDNVGDPDFSDIPFGLSNSSMKIWIQETNEILDIDPNPPVPVSSTQCYLKDIYTNPTITSSRFILGRTTSHGNTIYGLNIDSYEPIKVYVNGVKAINKTDYFGRQHPVMNAPTPGEGQYEYVQAGKAIYFNGPVTGKIEVVYDWLTQYLKLVATLRCNVPVATIFTPKVDRVKLRVKTTEL